MSMTVVFRNGKSVQYNNATNVIYNREWMSLTDGRYVLGVLSAAAVERVDAVAPCMVKTHDVQLPAPSLPVRRKVKRKPGLVRRLLRRVWKS
jgi:hypothetical protein